MIDPNTFLHKRVDNNTMYLAEILGCGSHGVVYLGQYKNKYYAVKCIADNAMSDNEIHMHSVLSGHKNILSLEKVIKEKKHIFIIMQYATHGDLFDFMKMKKKHSCLNTRFIYLQILDAVQHCHYNFIAHRDLKPENILLMSNYRVKLADFGLSTTHAISTEYYHGTSTYFSPECQDILFYSKPKYHKNNYYYYHQYMSESNNNNNNSIVSSKKYTPEGYDTFANDIWSLGIILVVLVFGRHPWLRANLCDPAFASYVSRPDIFFKQNFPNISHKFNILLQRIFCLDPENRITLTELRSKITKCDFNMTSSSSSVQPVKLISEKTLLEYTEFFTDNDDESDDDLVLTPANASPILDIKGTV